MHHPVWLLFTKFSGIGEIRPDNPHNPANPAIHKPHFDPVGMRERIRQYFLHNPPNPFTASLIFFLDDVNQKTDADRVPFVGIPASFHY
jgi:hypothetical protein